MTHTTNENSQMPAEPARILHLERATQALAEAGKRAAVAAAAFGALLVTATIAAFTHDLESVVELSILDFSIERGHAAQLLLLLAALAFYRLAGLLAFEDLLEYKVAHLFKDLGSKEALWCLHSPTFLFFNRFVVDALKPLGRAVPIAAHAIFWVLGLGYIFGLSLVMSARVSDGIHWLVSVIVVGVLCGAAVAVQQGVAQRDRIQEVIQGIEENESRFAHPTW